MKRFLTFVIAVTMIFYIIKNRIYPLSDYTKSVLDKKDSNSIVNTSNDKVLDDNLSGNFIEKSVSKVIINALRTQEGRAFFEHLIQPKNAPIKTGEYVIEVNRDLIKPLFNINTLGNGTEGPITCGQVALIHYQILDDNNYILDEGTKSFTLGARSIMPGLDIVATGMMVGQTRQAVIPSKYAYHSSLDKSKIRRVNIALNGILPKNFINPKEVRVFDDEISYKVPLLCGDLVSFDAKIIRLSDGKNLFSSKDIIMKIGDITYPLIVSYALHGKVPVGTRTIIAQGRAFKAPGSNINRMLHQSNIALEEYLLLELTNFKNLQE